MSNLAELIRRTERLRDQAELLRQEIDVLRQELQRLGPVANGSGSAPAAAQKDCLEVALALAQDLGPEFSSEEPHELSERGAEWFSEP